MNLYKRLRDDQQKRFNDFLSQYAFFAFSREQYKEGLDKLGIDPEAEGVLVPIGGGGFVLKEKIDDFSTLVNDTIKEQEAALADPESGDQFALDMFLYELANHEYTITLSTEETLAALGYTDDDVAARPQLAQALKKAKKILLTTEE